MIISHRSRGGALLLTLLLLLTMVGCIAQEPVSSVPGESTTSTSTTDFPTSVGTQQQTDPAATTTTTTNAGTTAQTTTTDKPTDPSSDPAITTTSLPATTTKPASAGNAAAILARMSLEEKVGQMFMPHLPDSFSAADIQKYAPAGYVLYAKDFSGKTKAEVQQMIARYQQASKIPLLISADEEGGSVVRISSNPALCDTPFLSPQNVYQNNGLTGLIRDTQEKSRLLLSLGVNLNLAPVCDFTTDKSSYIYKRTLGLSAEKTAEGIAAIVRTMEQEGISGALKHFPGYGSSTDTHAGIAYDHRDKSEFIRQDFLPFIAGIEQGVPSILISHNIVTCMDSDYPASLSKEVHRVLREELHFDGVIMTDDLSMGAIKQFASGSSPAVMAVLAGNDLLLTADWKKEYANVLSAVNSGVIPVSRVNDAVERILNWKIDKGLLSAG